jgi:hypothetical protein
MRLFAFILALLLLAGSVDPTRGWLITLVVVTGLVAVRPRFWNWFRVRPANDLRLASFILAILLLAGVVDPTRGWLIALSVVTGLAMTTPNFGIDLFGINRHDHHDYSWRWRRRAGRWASRADDAWDRRMDRMRRTDGWGDDWS